jgi:NADH dehydrogenase (ubiquinone) 1 alpha subcomplex subunit 13
LLKVDVYRTARPRGPTGLQLWLFSSLGIVYGFYRIGVCNRERSAERLADREARYAMAPILQAEEDRWYYEREKEIIAKEAAIMKDVKGWNASESQYLTKRWVPRQTFDLDRNLKK